MIPVRVFLRSVLEDFRAWRRGERRVAPRGVRGRIYEKRSVLAQRVAGETDAELVESKAIGTVEMKVVRKDGTVEFYEYPVYGTKE